MAEIVPLNKSIIQEAAACVRLAFLRVRDRNQKEKADVSASDEIRLMYGIKVGQKAREQFPGGKLIQADNFAGALAETRTALGSGEEIIFEAAFAFDGVAMKADILRRRKENEFDLFEVKSGTDPGNYFEDVAIQVWIPKNLGIKVHPYLMVIDTSATTESKSLFQTIDCRREVRELLPEIEKRIKAIQKTVRAGKIPDVPFTRACRDCDYFGECLPGLPDHHVFTLYRGGKKIDCLLNRGVLSLDSVPADMGLSDRQAVQVQTIISGKPWRSADLRRELNAAIVYPLYFLDFEAVMDPIPEYPNQRPYEVTPFQWSFHVQHSATVEPEHQEFLKDGPGDPRPAFVESLLRCVGDSGSIIVYSTFEQTALKKLGDAIPAAKPRITKLLPRLFDLHAVIRENFYHPEFRGSFSIKQVLPVLVPELSYDKLEVGDGMEAVRAYYRLAWGALPPAEHAALSTSLRKYCKLDTLAMVKVYQALKEL